MLSRARHVHVCPLCGGEAERVHRHLADRLLSVFRSAHRYRCRETGCEWEGLITSAQVRAARSAQSRTSPSWRSRALWFFAGIALTVAAIQGAKFHAANKAKNDALARAAAQRAAVAPLPVAIGESYDGEELADDDPRKGDSPPALTLRRGCAWGIPGRNPYTGTVVQALTAARVPQSAVLKLDAMVEKKLVSDRVQISRDGITTVSNRRSFDAKSFDMAFGTTLCFGTRVNFERGHVEHADLYEATDADGKKYTVMVPEVCGNVAVLGDQEERNGTTTNGSTPEPGTLAVAAAGLAPLIWFLRRRARVAKPDSRC